MARFNNGSAIWLVLICMTALISLCTMLSYRIARSAEIAALVKQREQQYQKAEALMMDAIARCITDWEQGSGLARQLNVELDENGHRIMALSCELYQTNSTWFIRNWRDY